MVLAVILAVAANISSPRLGQFFDLGSWVPTSVPADRQFGSAYATNATRRIDETALAAVNSIFEGWCERCYYPSCGTNNSWSAVDWGTPAPNSRFRFDAPAAHFSTNISPVRTPLFAYDPDTNRVCRTRRLVEYDNLKALADALISPGYRGLDYRIGAEDLTETYRPTWPRTRADAPDWDWTYDRPWVWWSSSAFDGISDFDGDTGDIDPPEFDWEGPENAVRECPHEWRQVARRFVDTYPHDTGLLIDWSKGPDQYSGEADPPIPYQLFSAVNYGEFDPTHGTMNRLDYYVFDDHMASNTMYVLRSAFDREWIDEKHVRYPVVLDFSHNLGWFLREYVGRGVIYATTNLPARVRVPVLLPVPELVGGHLSADWFVGQFAIVTDALGNDMYLDVGFSDALDVVANGVHLSDLSMSLYTHDTSVSPLPDFWYVVFDVTGGEKSQPGRVDMSPVGFAPLDDYDAVLHGSALRVCDFVFPVWVTNNLCKIEEITNVTRRLVSEPIAGISQVVSCLDRSYSLARFPPFSTVTNFHHNSHLVGEKELQYDEVSVSGYGNQLVVTLSDSGDKRFACENFTSNVSTYASSSGNPRPGTMFVRVSPVEEGLNRAAVRLENLIDVSVAESMEEVQAWLAAETNDYTAISSVAYADSMGSALYASATLAFGYNNPSPGVSAYLTLSGDELKGVIASAAFTRQYEREHSLAPSDEDYAAYDVVWPGRYDGRVGTAALWTLMSSADTYVTGSDYDLDARFVDYSASPWDSRSQYHGSCHSDTQYRSALDTYTDVGTCVSALKDATDAVRDKCLEEMRNDAQDFEDPNKFINPMCRRAVDYLQHMSLPGTISFSIGVYGYLYLSGTDVSSGINATVITQMIGAVRTGGGWVLHDDLMSLVVDPYAADTTVGVILHFSQDPFDSPWYYGSDPYRNDRFRGAVSNGKVSGVHRVDWDWKALRRTASGGSP